MKQKAKVEAGAKSMPCNTPFVLVKWLERGSSGTSQNDIVHRAKCDL